VEIFAGSGSPEITVRSVPVQETTPGWAITEEETVELQGLFDVLRANIEAEAPHDVQQGALEPADELQQAVNAKQPDLSTME